MCIHILHGTNAVCYVHNPLNLQGIRVSGYLILTGEPSATGYSNRYGIEQKKVYVKYFFHVEITDLSRRDQVEEVL